MVLSCHQTFLIRVWGLSTRLLVTCDHESLQPDSQSSVIKPTRSRNLGVVVGCYDNRQSLFLVQPNSIKSILEDNTNMAS